MKVSVTEVAAEWEVKSAIASAEEIIETASENQPEYQPEASEQVNEEIPLANEECSSVALNDATEDVAPPDAPSGQFQNYFQLSDWLSWESRLGTPEES